MKLVGKRVLVIDLEEEARGLMVDIKETYNGIIKALIEDGEKLSMDFIQESGVYDNYTHAYNEYLYEYIEENLDKLLEVLK